METERRGHGIELAEQAVSDGIDVLAVGGGDGTLHEVVQGLVAADALGSVTVCLVPTGTENITATDLGIPSPSAGFDVAERGETRRLDLGVVNDEPFVLSAIAGLPADVSAAATHDLKERFGEFGFVVGAIEEGLAFDGIEVEVDAVSDGGELQWSGEALCVLVGNVRRFAGGGGQANAEDGLLELAIVEQMPTGVAVAEAIEQRLLHRDTPHVTELRVSSLAAVSLDGDPITFSLDGEIRSFEETEVEVVPRALRIRVGDDYDPDPVNGDGNRE